jgi:hypothetical protein
MDALVVIAQSWRLAIEEGATSKRERDRLVAQARAAALLDAATAILVERRVVALRSVDVVATLSRLSAPTKG